MKKRLSEAITKLYAAYDTGNLHPECSCTCAVGTILDGRKDWTHLQTSHGSLQLSRLGLLHQNLNRKFNGYTPHELMQIETVFLEGCGYELPLNYKFHRPSKNEINSKLFLALDRTIDFLYALDGEKRGENLHRKANLNSVPRAKRLQDFLTI